jgi:tetratricopeptide (TPR) repeat protein
MTPKSPLGGLLKRTAPRHSPWQTAFDTGRLARAGEHYDAALAAFEQAHELADSAAQRSAVDQLRAETLIEAGRLEEAGAIIAQLRTDAIGAQRVYGLIAAGLLAQAESRLDDAHTLLDDAQEVARINGLAGAEGRAACHLADIYLSEGNASYAAHVLREALPHLTTPTDIDWSPYFVGRLGQALFASGSEIEGLQLLQRGIELAEAASNRRCQRMWSLALGELAVANRRYAEARPLLEAALARTDGRPPQEVAQVRRLLAETCLALREDRLAAEHAMAAVSAAQDAGDTALVNRSRGVLGVVLRAQGEPEQALPHLQAGAGEEGTPQVRRALGAALTEMGQPDAARALFEAAVESAPEGSLELAEAKRDLGVHEFQRRHYHEAVAAWTAAASLFEALHEYAPAARVHVDLSGARRALGQYGRSYKDIDQALTLLSHVPSTDDETRGVVLANAAMACAEQGDVETADAFFNDSVVIAQRMGDRAAESLRSGNYGWFLTVVGRPRRAMANLEHALRISTELNLALLRAVQTDNLGLAFDAIGDAAAALTQHRAAMAQIETLDEPYWKTSFQVNLAATLTRLNEADEAEPLLGEALAWARAHPYAELLVRALTALSVLRVAQGRAEDAPTAEAVALARHQELRRLLADALSAQSQCEAALGRAEAARATWADALNLYSALKMPQARLTPGWLGDRKTP